MGRLFSELKRRNIFRVAVAYAVAAWVLLQIADLILENIGAPLWVIQAFMLLLALGFPLVLAFSWAFEITSEGIRRDKDVDRNASITQRTGQRLDRLTIALLGFVLVILGVERLLLDVEPKVDVEPKGAAAPIPGVEIGDRSIAVLAFEDLSATGDQEYFAEGISEELLNVLAQIPDLQVAGRTSSFAFKGQQRDLREIGESLNVAHILEGSVRTSGNRVRVTAQLIKANDGFHLFSRSYDRELTDIFEVQDDLAQEISAALRLAIMGEKTIEKATPTDLASYDRYLRARQWIHTRDRVLMEEANDLLDEALTIDPDYAPALAQKALVVLLLSDGVGTYGEISRQDALQMSRPLLDRSLEIDPEFAEAHAVLGLWHSNSAFPHESSEAIASLKRALEINPSMANANNWLANALGSADDTRERERLYEFVVEHDPLYMPAFTNLTGQYLFRRQLDKAEALIRRVERIDGSSREVLFTRGALLLLTGELAEAVTTLQQAYEFNTSESSAQGAYQTATFFVGDLERSIETSAPPEKLLPLEIAGRGDEAEALFGSLDRSILANSRGSIGSWLLLRERPRELIAYMEKIDGDDWLEKQPQPVGLMGADHWTNIAYALSLSGRDSDAREMLSRIRGQLDAQARNGADNLMYWLSEAEYAAMAEEPATMLESLRRAMDSGMTCVFGFWPAQFDRYRTDPGFIELEKEMIRRANVERQKLGMSPLPSLLSTT